MTEYSDREHCGTLFVATGKDYLELACDAAASVIQTNPKLEIDLYTDCVDSVPAGIFDEVHQIKSPHARSKLECMPLSRFERTLFLDCDTRVIADLGDLFRLLDQFELAMAHDVRRKSDLIKEGLNESTPYCFPQLNSGVVLYRKCAETNAFFSQWNRAFKASGLGRDQVVLKDLLWKTNLRFYVLPPEFNLRRVTLLDAWEPLDAIPTIIHSHIFLQHLRYPGMKKITEVQELLDIERENLQTEWQKTGLINPRDKWKLDRV